MQGPVTSHEADHVYTGETAMESRCVNVANEVEGDQTFTMQGNTYAMGDFDQCLSNWPYT